MSEEKQPAASKGSASLLDVLTSKIAKIGALVAVLAALVSGIVKIVTGLGGLIPEPPDPITVDVPFKDCVSVKMVHAKEVALDEWDSMDLRLTGENNCRESVLAYVSFQARPTQLRITSPYCDDPNNKDCWDEPMLEPGKVDYKVTPPHLEPLQDSLADPVKIDIKWHLKLADQTSLDTGKANITVHDNTARSGAD